MKYLLLFLSALLMVAACNLSEDEDLRTTYNDDDDGVITLPSTQKECDSLSEEFGEDPTDEELAILYECLLNIGIDADDVVANCDSQDEYQDPSFCTHPDSIAFQTIGSYESDLTSQVVNNTDDCDPCINPDPTIGCRTIVYEVSYVSDECHGGGSGEWTFDVTATVYCCD